MLFVSWRVSALKPTAAAYEHICKWIIKSIKYWHDERNLNLGKLVYSIHTFIFSDIFAWFWFHYKNVCSCLLLYQKPLYVVYYSTRNHYMLFITLPENTICCLLLYQKTLYVVYYSTRKHYMLFIVSVSVFFASSLYLDFQVLDITLTMFTLDFTFIPQRVRLVVLRYRYHNLSSIWIIMLQTWPHHLEVWFIKWSTGYVERLVTW